MKMDCDGCERRVKNTVRRMKGSYIKKKFVIVIYSKLIMVRYNKRNYCDLISGVKTVEVIRKQHRVIVSGYVDPQRVLNRIKSTGKRAEMWPYVPYNLVSYPYVAQAYDKKAPSGFVKNVPQALITPNATEERITHLFSDDNPNACSIM